MSAELLDFLIQIKESGVAEASSDLTKLARSFAAAQGAAAKLDAINAKGNNAKELAGLKSKLKQEELLFKDSLKVKNKARSGGGAPGGGGSGAAEAAGEMGALEESLGGVLGVVGAVSAAVAALGVVLGGLTLAGAAFAIEAVTAKQSLQQTLGALLDNESAGVALQQNLEDLAKTLPVSSDRVNDLAVSLVNAGVTGDALTDTIKSLAAVESTVGAEGAGKIKNLIEKWNAVGSVEPLNAKALAGTGVTIKGFQEQLGKQLGKTPAQIAALMKAGAISTDQGVTAINAVIENKLGNVAAKKLLGFGVQVSKLKDNIGNLFDDVDISGFSAGFAKLVSIFDSNTAAGKALKFVVTGFFDEFFALASKVLPYVEYGFKALIIAGLKTFIAFKEFRKTDLFAKLVTGLKVVGYLFLGLGAIVVAALAPFIIAGVIIAGAFAVLIAGVVASIAFIGYLADAISDNIGAVWDWLVGFATGFYDIGANIVQGIIDGITDGAGLLLDSVKNLGSSAIASLKSVLGIHSPSKAFMDLGGHTAAGFALGVDKGAANDVAPAVSSMVSTTPGAGASSGGGGGNTINIVINITPTAGANSEEIADMAVQKLMSALEGTGLSIGAASKAA